MILPDILEPDLKLVFCGTAAGRKSAEEQAYYAHPLNRFYGMLHETGLTDRKLDPQEFRSLLTYGIGLTDLNKMESGNDDQLSKDGFDVAAFRHKIEMCQPEIVAFTSKTAGAAFLGIKNTANIHYGRQGVNIDDTEVWVLPSTSGRTIGQWKQQRLDAYWHDLAEDIKNRPE